MKLLLIGHTRTMRENSRTNQARAAAGDAPFDFKPVVKLFSPWGANTWLLSELDADSDTMFGLCDLGMGCPELGYVSLHELSSVKGPMGLHIERDLYFEANKRLSEYTDEARAKGRINA